MKKFGYVLAAVGAIAVAAPSIASAETVVINHRDHGWHGARAQIHRDWHRDRGWHHHDRVVVIKKHRY